MIQRLEVILFLILGLCVISKAQNVDDLKGANRLYGFIENKGQVVDQDHRPNPSAQYILPLPNNNVILRATGFSYDTYIVEEKDSLDTTTNTFFVKPESGERIKQYIYRYHRVDVEFANSNSNVQIIPSNRSKDYVHYYTQGDGQQIRVYHFGKITYKNVYPGIDVEFTARPGKNKPVEYNFVAHPGADIRDIQIDYKGAKESKLKNGKVELTLAHGLLSESIPLSYIKESNKKVKISYRRIRRKGGEIIVGFEGPSTVNETLIIDPVPTLDWETTFGGAGAEDVRKISTDGSSNVYVAGFTTSSTSLATSGAHQTTNQGGQDAFVAKYNQGGILQWCTYYGGSGGDVALGIASTSTGTIYVCGNTNSLGSISTPGAHKESFIGGTFDQADGFVVKFDTNGTRQWGTYFGGPRLDEGVGITLDDADNIYLTGRSFSETGISTPGSYQSSLNGDADAFVAKFNSNGILIWSTYYGGESNDLGYDLTTDSFGSIYILGDTYSMNNVSTPGAHQTVKAEDQWNPDAFLVKFNSSGLRQWATYYGGSLDEWPRSIVCDDANNVYFAGRTQSSASISTPGSFQETIMGAENGFLVKLNSNGVRQWASYFGGNGTAIMALGSDGLGNLYFAGFTISSSDVAIPDAYQATYGGQGDAFLAKFNSNGQRIWSTYYGGTIQEWGYSLAFNTSMTQIFVAGHTYDPVTANRDGFLARFSETACTAPEAVGLEIQATQYVCTMKFSTQKLQNCLASYIWNFGDGTSSLEASPLHVYASQGTYTVTVQINYNCPSCEGEISLTKQVEYEISAEILENRVIEITTDIKEQVISTSASSFSDVWPLDQTNNTLDNRSSYSNGSQGVWRNNASFVYEKDRQLSSTPTIATDGTFTLEQFNWEFAELNAVPNWIRANKVTQYSPYSYELENQDVLGVSSGVIYDYGGQLPAANGVNMRHEEMAFTGFEYLDGAVAGNWIFSTGSIPVYTIYTINAANRNIAIVEATLSQLEDVTEVDVIADKTYFYFHRYTNTFSKNEIICKQVHPENPQWSIIVLKRSPFDGIWTGSLRIKNIATPSVSSVIDNSIAHSGKSSLKINSIKTFKQELLRLEAGKSYWVNCWVSVNNPWVTTPVLAANLGIDILAKDKLGQLLSTFSFQPSGTVIEGWQQVKGSFICPASTAYIEIKFKPGSIGTSWYDDLRLHPENGNMKGYVYDLSDFRLRAVLDEENFASYFYYDREGNLYLTKKETRDGIKTLSENVSHLVER